MTPEEHRRLDADVAEKVMGWTIPRGDEWSDPPDLGTRPRSEYPFEQIPHYSTDIAAAWQVIERLRERGHWVDIRDDRPNRWRVSFGEEMTGKADTAPLAICHAALEAIER